MTPLTLFTDDAEPQPVEPEPFERGRRGSERASRRWTAEQVDAVDAAIENCARRLTEFTADDVWAALGDEFPVTKGLTARLVVARNAGLIAGTDQLRKTHRGGVHDKGQRLSVWRSLITRGEP